MRVHPSAGAVVRGPRTRGLTLRAGSHAMAAFDLGEGRGSLALAAEDALSGDASSLLARPASQLAVESSLEQFSDIRKGVRSLSVAERVERARLVTGDTQRAYTSSALRATTDLGKGGVRGGPASVGTSGATSPRPGRTLSGCVWERSGTAWALCVPACATSLL